MNKGEGNLFMVVSLVFLFIMTRLLIGSYDSAIGQYGGSSENLCLATDTSLNETMPMIETASQDTDIWSFITGIKCSNLPSWFILLIYSPAIIGLIYLFIPIPFKA